jgi:hypothetical protein
LTGTIFLKTNIASSNAEASPGGYIDMTRFFLLLAFSAAFWVNPVAGAGDDALYMVGLEVHASKSVTPAETEKISRYLFQNITKWSPGAAMIVYEGDTRGGGSKVDLNVVVYISKLGKAYSLFVENTDEVALRKELMEKGISKADVDTLVGNPESPLSRTSGTNWGIVPKSNLFESLDGIIKNIVSVVRQVEDEGPPTARIEPVPTP